MDNIELENEIELRMNPEDFSVSSSDLMDIMNMFDIDEESIVFIYSKIVDKKSEELASTTEEVVNYFRDKGNYYPSFAEFKKLFGDYETQPIDDKILRNAYRKEVDDMNQTSLFEEMKQKIKNTMKEGRDNFEKAASKITKDWGGASKPTEKFSAEEFFGDAGDAAEADIRAEFGDDEFASFGSLENPNMLRDLDDIYEVVDERGLFQIEDAEGNIIKKHVIVKPVSGAQKFGRVMGFGDDGSGNTTLTVEWSWPTEMKFTNPEEMGKEKVYPKDIVLKKSNVNEDDSEYGGKGLRGVKVTYADGSVVPTSMAAHLTDDEILNYFKKGKVFNIGKGELDNMQAVVDAEILREENELSDDNSEGFSFDTKSIYHWFQDALYQLDGYDEAEAAEIMEKAFNRDYDYKLKMNEMNEEINDEEINEIDGCGTEEGDGLELDEMRGLSGTVKNSGDRNVKLRDDHHHAPLTNLDESLDSKIKKLSEGTVKKKDLMKFINEQARKLAKDIRDEE